MKRQILDRTMYKHSFGHCYTNREALVYMEELKKRYPTKELQVVYEKRSNPKWKRYCVCEYVPFKRDKDKVKKSNHKVTHKHSWYKKNKRNTSESK